MSTTTPLVKPAATFPVAVIMERVLRPVGRWSAEHWRAVAVLAGDSLDATPAQGDPIHTDSEGEQYLWQGFALQLYKDATESYWHNLMSAHPVLCVISQSDEDGRPVPVTVTADYDQASAGMEADDAVYAVPMPPEIYRWLETFVVEHFQPAPRKVRKRQAWLHEENHDAPPPRIRQTRS